MPAEKLEPGGNADIMVFKEIIKKGDFSRLGQTGSMIIFIKRCGRNSGRATSCISSAFVKMAALGAGKRDIIG